MVIATNIIRTRQVGGIKRYYYNDFNLFDLLKRILLCLGRVNDERHPLQ